MKEYAELYESLMNIAEFNCDDTNCSNCAFKSTTRRDLVNKKYKSGCISAIIGDVLKLNGEQI